MNQRSVVIGLSTLLFTTGVAAAQPDSSIRGVPAPSENAPLTSWTAAQQYQTRTDYGYPGWDGALALADELGDRLSHLGRASIVARCFRGDEVKYSLAQWALCRTDFAALDLKKAEAELVAAGVADEERTSVMGDITKAYEKAKVVVSQLDEEAKSDKGLQKMLGDVEAAKKEWADYLGGHRAEVDLYLKLRDAVRSGKRNAPGFDGCDALTRPRFEKHVRSVAKKIPYDNLALGGYVWYLVEGTDGYLATVSWAACGVSIHPAMELVYVNAAYLDVYRVRHGWRTLAIGKLAADGYKPRFADTSYALVTPGSSVIFPKGLKASPNDGTSRYAEVKKVTKRDDEVLIHLSDDDSEPVVVAGAYAAGIKPNLTVQHQREVPIVVYDAKKQKLHAVFGVTIK